MTHNLIKIVESLEEIVNKKTKDKLKIVYLIKYLKTDKWIFKNIEIPFIIKILEINYDAMKDFKEWDKEKTFFTEIKQNIKTIRSFKMRERRVLPVPLKA